MEKKKVKITLDAETNGLWGRVFAIGAIAYDEDGNRISVFQGRTSMKEVDNPWVVENVVPHLQDIPVIEEEGIEKPYTHKPLLKAFAEYYQDLREQYEVRVLWHMGHVVEAHLFRQLVNLGYIGEWDAPYVPIEVASFLEVMGYQPDSVDKYVSERGIKINIGGSTHHPLYDCEVAYQAYEDLIKNHFTYRRDNTSQNDSEERLHNAMRHVM